MSQVPVKWVEPNFLLTDIDKLRYSSKRRQRDMIPVIPLSALREVVEGLKEINAKSVIAYSIAPELSATACLEINKIAQRLLASLGGGGK